MLPASSSGPAFQAVNAFHLRPGQDPPRLQPQAVYTYDRGESFNQVDFDISHNLCAPFRIRTWALWLEPAEDDRRNPEDHSLPDEPATGDDGTDPAPAGDDRSEASEADDISVDVDVIAETDVASDVNAAAENETPVATPGESAPAGPAHHPDAMTFDIMQTFQQLPPHLQRDFQFRISAAIQMGVEYFQLTGLSEDEALNNMRSLSWGFIRDMTPLQVARAKRQRYYDPEKGSYKGSGKGAPSSSAKGWF